MDKAKFYKQLDQKSVQCQLCNHFCLIKNQKTGKCRVRLNENGKLYSLVYGYPVAINVDPIEKKPLFHFFPGTRTLSLGTLGCNFTCHNCQNWDLSQKENIKKYINDINFVDPERIIEEAVGNDCQSISYTYNEPTVFTEYALEIMKIARTEGLKNIWVSNGFMSKECLEKIIPYLDAINVDLKSMDNFFYKKYCSAQLKPILNNLITLKQEQIHLEITTLVIPSLSDDIDMLAQLADFIVSDLDTDTPWHVSKFSSNISWKLKDKANTGDDIIYEALNIGENAGLLYCYAGNMPGDQNENTYCPKCKELAIRRMGYHIERLDNQGRCNYCDRSLDIFD